MKGKFTAIMLILVIAWGMGAVQSFGQSIAVCGNLVLETGEECDGTTYCGQDCQCISPYVPDPDNPGYCKAASVCGNNTLEEGEECELFSRYCVNCRCTEGTVPDPAYPGFCTSISVDIKKYTNGEDADIPPGPFLLEGATVEWHFVVKNVGTRSLQNGRIEDDQLGHPCWPVTFALGPGDTYECTVSGTAQPGQHRNIATVYMKDSQGNVVQDSDASHCYGYGSIADILNAFDLLVENGNLVGSGPGRSAQGRLNALRNMIRSAGELINQGRIAAACVQLQDAYNRCDGFTRPPDFASGNAASDLANMIWIFRESLGCQ